MLPLGRHGDFKLPYFRNEGILTKSFLISLIKDKNAYSDYLPDKVNLENISKDYLFSVRIFLTFLADSLRRT